MLEIFHTNQFKKDFKKTKRQGESLKKLEEILISLQEQQALSPKYKDHTLTGDYIGTRECHIEPDWLLIYKIDGDKLILALVQIDLHSELFRWIGKILQTSKKTLLDDQTNSSVFLIIRLY